MDFYKFSWMLENSALFFARTDTLGDEFEGSYPETSRIGKQKAWADIVRRGLEEGKARNLILDKTPEEAISELRLWVRYWIWVNCWHMAEVESAAMWRIYGGYESQSIAIQSDYTSLCTCLPPEAHVGIVRYLDYNSESIPETQMLTPILHKRLEYTADQELRAVIDCMPKHESGLVVVNERKGDSGRIVPVDLGKLLKSICVAPKAKDAFLEHIERLVMRYGLSIPVRRSSLSAQPFF